MIDSTDLDVLLRRHYSGADGMAASEDQIADVLRAVAATRQRAGVLGWRGSARAGRVRVARPLLRGIILAGLLVALVAGAVIVGSGLLRAPQPTPRTYEGVFEPVDPVPVTITPGLGVRSLTPLADGRALAVAAYAFDVPGDELFLFDPLAGTWTGAGRLLHDRFSPLTALLPDGRVLLLGGEAVGASLSAEIFDPGTGSLVATGRPLLRHREGDNAATTLVDGRVLVAGGDTFTSTSAEIFDPATGVFSMTGTMTRHRSGLTMVPLRDGRALVFGGDDLDDGVPTAELYDPAVGTFAPAGPMALPHFGGSAVAVLSDGRVLIVGGWFGDGPSDTAAAEVFDPSTDTFTRTPGSLPAPRHWAVAATLEDGRALIVGGYGVDAIEEGDDAFLYQPDSGLFAATAPMTTQRLDPSIATLADGRVLVVGNRCRNLGCYGLGDPSEGPGDPSDGSVRERSAEIYR